MQIYRVETTLTQPGILTLTGLPFRVGERVQIMVSPQTQKPSPNKRYPLRGQPIQYSDPFEPVAEEEWEVLL